MKTPLILTLLLFLSVNELQAQLIFEKDEYRSRREKLMDKIPDGIAIIRGASESLAGLPFTQYNNMMYFAGVEIPDAILIVDGEKRESTVFFTIDEHHADGENISLDLVREPVKITGIEHYRPYLDFMQCAKDVSGMNLDWFFEQFLFKPGHAVFEVAKHWDEATKTLSLEIKQTQDKWEDVPIYRIPVQLGFYHPDGKSVEKVWLKESVEKFEFKFDKAPLLVRFDEGNYLLKELIYPQSED
uniref:aminopeptidase P N-terminal domain-containing protein n=1 Tax=Aquiflexum sp. TaxID=1872584 RepID=UPI0035930589